MSFEIVLGDAGTEGLTCIEGLTLVRDDDKTTDGLANGLDTIGLAVSDALTAGDRPAIIDADGEIVTVGLPLTAADGMSFQPNSWEGGCV